jgi:hypothetical protein
MPTENSAAIFILTGINYLKMKIIREVCKSKAVPLHAMEALGGRGDIAPTHSRPRH